MERNQGSENGNRHAKGEIMMKLAEPMTHEDISALLQRAAAELLVLDENLRLKSGEIDVKELTEFRQMVDIVRHTAYVVHKWTDERDLLPSG